MFKTIIHTKNNLLRGKKEYRTSLDPSVKPERGKTAVVAELVCVTKTLIVDCFVNKDGIPIDPNCRPLESSVVECDINLSEGGGGSGDDGSSFPITPGDGGGGYHFGGGGGTNNKDKDIADHIDDSELKNNKCADEVYQKLKNTPGLFTDLLGLFEGESALDLKFNITDLDVVAKTYINGVKDGRVTITLNPNYLGSTELGRASTFIHEMLHAYFTWELVKAGWDGIDSEESYKTIDEENISDLLKAYKDNFYRSGLSEHQFMTQDYIPKIVNALKAYDPDLGTDAEYEALAWLGLHETDLFKKMNQENQVHAETILAIISDNLKNQSCAK